MTTTNVITKTTLESNPHNNIISYLNNRNYITDPKSPNSTTPDRTFVYDEDPFMKALNFGDLPYILCEFPTIQYSNLSTDGKIKTIAWLHQIIIRSARDGGSNARQSVGRSDLLSIGDDLQSLFNSEARKAEFRALRMYNLDLRKVNVDTLAIQQKPLLEWAYELKYDERIKVSD